MEMMTIITDELNAYSYHLALLICCFRFLTYQGKILGAESKKWSSEEVKRKMAIIGAVGRVNRVEISGRSVWVS